MRILKMKSPFRSIQTQFLCCVPIKKIQWKNVLDNLSWGDQKRLLDETVDMLALQTYPLDANYVIRFIRCVIQTLEAQNLDIHDDLYTTLCAYQANCSELTEYAFKHYQIGDESVVLQENRNKISQGTTGLNVWESALALSDWAIQNTHLFRGKCILELGAGTGLTSLIISKCCSAKSINITDGNDTVIGNLLENVCNNFEKSDGSYRSTRGTLIEVIKLDWMESSKEYIGQYFKQTELIVAADIIYDDTLFDSLLTTLRMLFNHCDNVSRFVLVNAVRNPDTEAQFLRMLGEFGFQYQEEQPIEPKLLYWEPNEFSPIKLYSIINKVT